MNVNELLTLTFAKNIPALSKTVNILPELSDALCCPKRILLSFRAERRLSSIQFGQHIIHAFESYRL